MPSADHADDGRHRNAQGANARHAAHLAGIEGYARELQWRLSRLGYLDTIYQAVGCNKRSALRRSRRKLRARWQGGGLRLRLIRFNGRHPPQRVPQRFRSPLYLTGGNPSAYAFFSTNSCTVRHRKSLSGDRHAHETIRGHAVGRDIGRRACRPVGCGRTSRPSGARCARPGRADGRRHGDATRTNQPSR